MKTLKLLCLALFLNSAIIAVPRVLTAPVFFQHPNKTVVIKDPNYTNAAAYFSGSTTYAFEVYNGGPADQLIASFKKNNAVQSMVAGKLTGNYQAFTLTLTSAKNKAWFVQQFTAAGLTNILINHNALVTVDKL